MSSGTLGLIGVLLADTASLRRIGMPVVPWRRWINIQPIVLRGALIDEMAGPPSPLHG
jgi:hypothetical protein